MRSLSAGSALLEAAQGRALDPLWRSIVEHRLDSARSTLGTQIVAAAWSEGEAMSRDEAIAYTRQQLGVSLLAVVAPRARR